MSLQSIVRPVARRPGTLPLAQRRNQRLITSADPDLDAGDKGKKRIPDIFPVLTRSGGQINPRPSP